jgi:hypothetical protein
MRDRTRSPEQGAAADIRRASLVSRAGRIAGAASWPDRPTERAAVVRSTATKKSRLTLRTLPGRMASMCRAVAAFLLTIIGLGASAPVTCAGWESKPSERMACCQRAAHDCADQSAADDCCAQQEQTHQPGTTMTAMTVAVPVPVASFFSTAADLSADIRTAASRFDGSPSARSHAPPGSFIQPLRI